MRILTSLVGLLLLWTGLAWADWRWVRYDTTTRKVKEGYVSAAGKFTAPPGPGEADVRIMFDTPTMDGAFLIVTPDLKRVEKDPDWLAAQAIEQAKVEQRKQHRRSAEAKLKTLGLTEDEVRALLRISGPEQPTGATP